MNQNNPVMAHIRTFLQSQPLFRDVQVAFLMARHPRLGVDSPAHWLPKDLFRFIFGLLKERVLVCGGLVHLSHLSRSIRDMKVFQPFYDDPVSTSACFFLDGTRREELPPMPVSLAFACGVVGEKYLFVLGGAERRAVGRWVTGADGPWEGKANLDAFFFSFKSKTWKTISCAIQRPCFRGASVIFGNKLIILGGHEGNGGVLTRDRAFDISNKSELVRVHFPQRRNLSTHCWYVESSCVVIGKYLLAFCCYVSNHGRRRSQVDVVDLSNNFSNWICIPQLENANAFAHAGFGLLQGLLFVVGGLKGGSFRCAVDSVLIADLTKPILEWKKGAPLPIPLFGCVVVSSRDCLYCIGGSSGDDIKGFERSKFVYQYNGTVWKVWAELSTGLDSGAAVSFSVV
jgi:hypothetical protein